MLACVPTRECEQRENRRDASAVLRQRCSRSRNLARMKAAFFGGWNCLSLLIPGYARTILELSAASFNGMTSKIMVRGRQGDRVVDRVPRAIRERRRVSNLNQSARLTGRFDVLPVWRGRTLGERLQGPKRRSKWWRKSRSGIKVKRQKSDEMICICN